MGQRRDRQATCANANGQSNYSILLTQQDRSMSSITGSCLCGGVTYSVSSDPLRMAQCHCKGCQRASGTGHMSLAFFKQDDVTVNGTVHEYVSTADSGNENTRSFCPTCGSRMFGRNSSKPGIMALAVGTADDNSWFSPQAIVYNKDKPAWDHMASDLPAFDEMPPAPK